MGHELTIVIVPPEEEDLTATVMKLMAPHTLHTVEPYKVYWTEEEFGSILRDIISDYPGEKYQEWIEHRRSLGIEAGVDEKGYYEWNDESPHTRYVGWEIGGWDDIDRVVWPVADLPGDMVPRAIVTPDGQLHAPEQLWEHDRHWLKKVAAIKERYSGHTAVILNANV